MDFALPFISPLYAAGANRFFFADRCCEVESMYGHSLRQGVVFIGIASVVISSVILLSCVACLIPLVLSEEQINKHPLMAVNLVFCLVASCLSVYTLFISVLLLWQTRQQVTIVSTPQRKGNIFILCSLWYVSHISILTLYFLLFVTKIAVCFASSHYVAAVFTAFVLVLYQGTFIYFSVVINSYLHSLNQEGYL